MSYFHKLQNVSFQMVSRICISLLRVLSYRQLKFGYVILGENLKKGRILINASSEHLSKNNMVAVVERLFWLAIFCIYQRGIRLPDFRCVHVNRIMREIVILAKHVHVLIELLY
jgi:hypothetical protein